MQGPLRKEGWFSVRSVGRDSIVWSKNPECDLGSLKLRFPSNAGSEITLRNYQNLCTSSYDSPRKGVNRAGIRLLCS